MRKAKRWRYYCDFCSKSGGHGGHMKTHEKHCTSNPARSCRMCRTESPDTQRHLDAIVSGGVEALRMAARGCPACMLAAVKKATIPWSGEGPGRSFDFDFATEKGKWMSALDALRDPEDSYWGDWYGELVEAHQENEFPETDDPQGSRWRSRGKDCEKGCPR